MLHHTVDVPGVILTGAIALGGTTQPELSGHITVNGRIQGVFTLKGETLSGTLNGARVRVQLSV
jgi:hypothetical protein